MEFRIYIFPIVLIISFFFFIKSVIRLYKFMKLAKKTDYRLNNYKERIKKVLLIAFAQTKLLRDPIAGILHLLIFWAFIIFGFAVIESLIQGFIPKFNFSILGSFYSVITLSKDILGILVIIAVLISLYRRFVQKISRLNVDKAGKIDAALILLMIFFVAISMYGYNSAAFAENNFNYHSYELRPISASISNLLLKNSNVNFSVIYEIFWWLHILIIFAFLNYLPYSKHLHVITSIPNVFFAKLENQRNIIMPLNLEDDSVENFGSSDIEELSWKQILDGYSCTECGRCSFACPAHTVGKSLSPREIIVNIRKRTEDKAPLILSNVKEDEVLNKKLVHDYIRDIQLWECTTCMACVQECPVMIEHLDAIIDMRRYLVLSESEFPNNLNNVFKSLENNFTPWAFSQSERANWAEKLNIKTLAEDSGGEILFWVGCAGSFDNRYKKVTIAFAKIMQEAGIDFRILGTEEKCNGDTARRLGNEYLAQMLMQENIQTLNSYNVKKIVTACPHCFHSLKNEYPQFGGNFEVKHHSEFISELINEGKIKIKENSQISKVTYHDSCYLGRYNNVYNQPRFILQSTNSIELVEMKRNKSRGFCCGAGGGRMFLEDEEGGRINIERTREALETGAKTIAAACPFCMTMLTDGVKHFQKQEEIEVKDIAEIVLDNLQTNSH